MTDAKKALRELLAGSITKEEREARVKQEISKIAALGTTFTEANEAIRIVQENWTKNQGLPANEKIISRVEMMRYEHFLIGLSKDALTFFLALDCTLPEAMGMTEAYLARGIISMGEYEKGIEHLVTVADQYAAIIREAKHGFRSVAEMMQKAKGV
jgi:hypothetical protein